MPTQSALRRFLQTENLSCLIDPKADVKCLPLEGTIIICLPTGNAIADDITLKIHQIRQGWNKQLILYWIKRLDTSKQYDALRTTFIDDRPDEVRLHHGTLYTCALSLLDDFSQYEPEFQKRYQTWLTENNFVLLSIKTLLEVPRIHPYLYSLEHILTVSNMLVYTKLPKRNIPLFNILRGLTLAYMLCQREWMMLGIFTACWGVNLLLSWLFSSQGLQQLLLYYLTIIAPLTFPPLIAIMKLDANSRDIMAIHHTATGAEQMLAATVSFPVQLGYLGLVFLMFSRLPHKIQDNPHYQAGFQSLTILTAPHVIGFTKDWMLPLMRSQLPQWIFSKLSNTTDEHGLNTLRILCNPKTDCQLRVESSMFERTLDRFYENQTTAVSIKTPTISATCTMKSSSNESCRIYNLSCSLLFFPKVNTSDLAAIPQQDPVYSFGYFENC